MQKEICIVMRLFYGVTGSAWSACARLHYFFNSASTRSIPRSITAVLVVSISSAQRCNLSAVSFVSRRPISTFLVTSFLGRPILGDTCYPSFIAPAISMLSLPQKVNRHLKKIFRISQRASLKATPFVVRALREHVNEQDKLTRQIDGGANRYPIKGGTQTDSPCSGQTQ